MDTDTRTIAETCMNAAHDGSMSFPAIVGTLIAAGFDGYMVDYRRSTQTYYLPDGDSVTLEMPHNDGMVAAPFDAAAVAVQVKWAQANGPDYSYGLFCSHVKTAGCAGYLVSFPGRRVLYFGRDGATHVEHFPQ